MIRATSEIRVRYAETDQMGVVYYANYFTWFEVGRTDLLRRLGTTYRELERRSVFLPVVEAQCRYVKPARYDDLLRITTEAAQSDRVRLTFTYEIHHVPQDGDVEVLLATGTTQHVVVDASGRPCRIPEVLTRLFT